MWKRKHYKFTDKYIPRRGVASALLLATALAMLVYGLYLSFRAGGNGGVMVGVMGTGCLLSAAIGLFLGLNSLKDEDVFHGFSWVGSVGNAILCLFILLMIMIGI